MSDTPSSNDPNPDDEVRIYSPPKSLLEKIGVANLDEIFSPRAMKIAQDVIDNSADKFMDDVMMRVDELESASAALGKDSAAQTDMAQVIAAAFSIKGTSGLAGYELVSEIAKSLYLYCEILGHPPLSQKTRDVIQWHVVSIRQMLRLKVKGKGGAVGDAIMAELSRLNAPQSSV